MSSFEHDRSHLLRSELASAIDFFRDSNKWDGHWPLSGAVFNIISWLPRKGWTLFWFCCGYILTIAGTSLVLWNRVVFNALANTTIMIAVFLFLITSCYLKIYLTLETSKWVLSSGSPFTALIWNSPTKDPLCKRHNFNLTQYKKTHGKQYVVCQLWFHPLLSSIVLHFGSHSCEGNQQN